MLSAIHSLSLLYFFIIILFCAGVFLVFVCLFVCLWNIGSENIGGKCANGHTCIMFHHHAHTTKQCYLSWWSWVSSNSLTVFLCYLICFSSGWHCFLWAVVTGLPSWCHYWYGRVHKKTIDSNLRFGQISQNMELWSMVRHCLWLQYILH